MEFSSALELIRKVPDFPKPGILFQDITPVLANSDAFTAVIKEMAKSLPNIDVVAGIEARGFILAAALAGASAKGFVPFRKSGKLPRATFRAEYELEYGADSIEIHQDALTKNDRVLIVDDVLATGGTACAAIDLIQECGAEVLGIAVLLDLAFLGGSAKVASRDSRIDVFAVL